MPEKSLVTQQHMKQKMVDCSRQLRREQTPAEALLWDHLRGGRLAGWKFRRQHVIGQYIVDFYCHAAALVVEVDGDVLFKQEDYDRQRDLYLKNLGLKVLHFWNSDINEGIDDVLEAILTACQNLPTPQSPPFREGRL